MSDLITANTTTTSPTGLAALTAGSWNVDAGHSTIGFVVRHLMVAKVRGQFTDFTGSITVADNPLESKVEATVQMASISTRDEGRDGHLRSGDFFDVEQFPTMSLVSTGIDAVGSEYVLHTQLTLKGVTKAVDFALQFDGVATDPWGNTKAGFTAEAEINRKDWGMEWNVALEAGGFVVGEKVKIQLEIEALKA
jgi:polyisoprenoid-binding protein YceI